jgi:glutamate---cysteine ligase / carboxylate-amine ligase
MPTTFGIEEELLVVDLGTGELVPRGAELLDAARPALGELIVSELNGCQVETNTEVCTTLEDAATQLETLRAGLTAAGGPLGMRPVPLASHPWSAWHDQEVNTEKEHYRTLLDSYQQVARETVICGCHVHVGVDDPEDRIQAMNVVTQWLPTLLALSTNSPWWQGTDTGYASYRTLVWKSWPTATMPPRLKDHDSFVRLLESLQAVDAIDDPSAVYWHVRPSSKLPTLEFRVADTCLRVEDAVTLAGLARAITTTALEERWSSDDVPPTALLDTALWRASRHGLESTLVDPTTASLQPAPQVLRTLLGVVEEALRGAGDYERVSEGVERLLASGTGAAVQRRILGSGGGDRRIVLERILSA